MLIMIMMIGASFIEFPTSKPNILVKSWTLCWWLWQKWWIGDDHDDYDNVIYYRNRECWELNKTLCEVVVWLLLHLNVGHLTIMMMTVKLTVTLAMLAMMLTSNFCSLPRSPRKVTKSVPLDLRLHRIKEELTTIMIHDNSHDDHHYKTWIMKWMKIWKAGTWSYGGTPAWFHRPFGVFYRRSQPFGSRQSSMSPTMIIFM